jgi:hypothetical protein
MSASPDPQTTRAFVWKLEQLNVNCTSISDVVVAQFFSLFIHFPSCMAVPNQSTLSKGSSSSPLCGCTLLTNDHRDECYHICSCLGSVYPAVLPSLTDTCAYYEYGARSPFVLRACRLALSGHLLRDVAFAPHTARRQAEIFLRGRVHGIGADRFGGLCASIRPGGRNVHASSRDRRLIAFALFRC